MLSKTRTTPAESPAPGVPDTIADPVTLALVVYEDNGGGHHWTLVADDGEMVVRSDSFESHEEAERAALIVHRAASSASFEDRTAPR